MSDNPDTAEATATSPPKKKRVKAKPREERGQTKIPFPYQDLESGISVAKALLDAGGVGLSREQLAGVMKLAVGGGNFVLKVATAKMFGLISANGGKNELTTLGFSILDPQRQRAARAEAFLTVPLYKRVYDEFRGKPLPPRPLGLERAFVQFGVPPKQSGVARQVFDKSATQAGFFSNGSDRLIEPIIGASAIVADRPAEELPPPPEGRGAAAVVRTGLHPFIQGLLDTLPAPETNWAVEGRAKWLQAAAHCFDLIYKGSGEIAIQAKSSQATRPAAAPDAPASRPVAQQANTSGRLPPDDDIPF